MKEEYQKKENYRSENMTPEEKEKEKKKKERRETKKKQALRIDQIANQLAYEKDFLGQLEKESPTGEKEREMETSQRDERSKRRKDLILTVAKNQVALKEAQDSVVTSKKPEKREAQTVAAQMIATRGEKSRKELILQETGKGPHKIRKETKIEIRKAREGIKKGN
jgi:hypothetical protein